MAASPETPENGKRLDSWKEIAGYLGRDVRTAMRWEKERGLPVHRVPGKRSVVYALRPEIDDWLRVARSSGNGHAEGTAAPDQGRRRTPNLWVWATLIPLLFGMGTAGLLLSGAGAVPPRLIKPVRLTNDGLYKATLLVAGSTLFYESRDGERQTIMKMAASGDESPSTVPYSAQDMRLVGAYPGRSDLLVLRKGPQGCPFSLWVVHAAGGSDPEMPDVCPEAAALSRDGTALAYTAGNTLYLANGDGANRRLLMRLPSGQDADLGWSPDEKRLWCGLTDNDGTGTSRRLWEIDLGRRSATRILPGWTRAALDMEISAEWKPDGSFLVFAAIHESTAGIWALRGHRSFFDWSGAKVTRLTSNPAGVGYPVFSPDGKKLFATLHSPVRGELVRYDSHVKQFVTWPGMPGLSAGHVAFSPDGKRAAYVTYPEMNLWTMNADGSERRQIGVRAALPQWSPDGRRIAYMGSVPGPNPPTKIRVISAEGGVPSEPVEWPGWQGVPVWTPDGNGLVFGENGETFPIRVSCMLHYFDFRTGKTRDLPGTAGLWTARMSPRGRYVAATTRDQQRLVLYDMRTAHVTELAKFPDSVVGDNPTWSRDGRYIYVDAPLSQDPAIYRIRVADRHLERAASLRGIQRANQWMGAWIGLTPNNEPLIVRQVQGSEIYSWDWVSP